MAFEGSLEDLSVIDILQLLHVSRKTGTLFVDGPSGDARIFLKEGDIIGAIHPVESVNVGQILIEMGAVTQKDIGTALLRQEEAGDDKQPLVGTLVGLGCVSEDLGWKALEKLVEMTVVEVIGSETGTFCFEVGDIRTTDSFRHIPEGVAAEVSVDTQAALMEAVRILDERNRPVEEPPPLCSSEMAHPSGETTIPDLSSLTTETNEHIATTTDLRPALMHETPEEPDNLSVKQDDELFSLIGERLEGTGADWDLVHKKAVLFCKDGFLKHSIRSVCRDARIDLLVSEVEQDILQNLLRWKAPGILPVTIVDFANAESGTRWFERSVYLLKRVHEIHPELPIIVLCGPEMEHYADAFALGATAVIPRPNDEISRNVYIDEMKALFGTIVTSLTAMYERQSTLAHMVLECRQQMTVLKQHIQEIRFPNGPSDISLIVLRFVADFVERCVLFLVRKNDLLGLGAFGLDDTGETLSSAITKLKIPFTNDSILSNTVRNGTFFYGDGNDPLLETYLYPGIGPPANPQIILLPLRTADKTAALIYGDFGSREVTAVHSDALEILADHAGMAFDLALWRRRGVSG